jgi:CRISPR-associated endonuclease/helicase Cas3
MSLSASDFPKFYESLHGYEPFPWQRELVKRIISDPDGRWPSVLALPTSAGKTSAIDVAVFLLALEADKPIAERREAIRTFFVVDRRIVVDEAGEHARCIARKLNDAPADSTILRQVADQLRQFGGEKALHVSVLRGGMYRDGSWAEAPNQPTVCLSTVDQVGSRLLFRGYGVSPHQRAVHAGLVGNDSLIILDEAHLSQPFRETLRAVEFYRKWAEGGHTIRTPFQAVFMSATLEANGEPFRHSKEDEENEEFGRRLRASKRAKLIEVRVGDEEQEEDNRAVFAAAIVDQAVTLSGLGAAEPPPARKRRKGPQPAEVPHPVPPANVIGVVVNRVDTARRVYNLLHSQRNPESPAFDVILLTGRIRPYDRDRLLDHWLNIMRASRERPAPPHSKLFVVATQTIEVGANVSFDSLVTEIAPIDALRQRFGRLDRLGYRGLSDAVIIARKDAVAARADDSVYGTAIAATWAWLKQQERASGRARLIDFGLQALSVSTDTAELTALCTPARSAPVMLPAHVETWVQTTPTPVPDADVALFLHGPEAGPADVNLVWRADLECEEGEKRISLLESNPMLAADVVALVPPTSMEALPLPVWHVKAWLRQGERGRPPAEFADVEGEQRSEEGRRGPRGWPCLRWRGPDDDDTTVIRADDIQPGDTVIVPCSYGGADEFGWNPADRTPVADVADDCSWRAKRRPLLRIHRDCPVHQFAVAAWSALPEPLPVEVVDRLRAWVAGADEETGGLDWNALPGLGGELPKSFQWLRGAKGIRYPNTKAGSDACAGIVLIARGQPRKHPAEPTDEDDDAPPPGDDSSLTGTNEPIFLDQHCRGVREGVDRFATAIRLAKPLVVILNKVADLHDAGKADPRFQLWLHSANQQAWAGADALLAKSQGVDARSRSNSNTARWRAGWPKHARHEALSVLMVQECRAALEGLADHECDLLLYLIGTHHGYGRPFWEIANDPDVLSRETPDVVECELAGHRLCAQGRFRPEAALASLADGWVERFWRLVRRHGYWGLAYLETLLVLADHMQSARERERGEK